MSVILTAALAVCPWMPAQPALLVDPMAAYQAAMAAPKEDALAAAETLVLLGDRRSGQAALDVLRRSGADDDAPRRLRLALRALVALEDERALRRGSARLADRPGWRTTARAAHQAADGLKRRRWLERTGLGMFAFALALLSIGGARALLGLRRASVVAAVAAVAAVVVIRSSVPRAAPLIALAGGGVLALAHAAAAAVDRTRPDPRGRLLVIALMGLGSGGLVAALIARLTVVGALDLLAVR